MANMMIHWLGAGLASVPGLRRLVERGHRVTLWERDETRAMAAVEGLVGDYIIGKADDGALEAALRTGDIVISMLPAGMHVAIARLCLEKGAHFVSSSYISAEMRGLDNEAKSKGLTFINEVGLDPGIDHLLAHKLIADYKNSPVFDPANSHDFTSLCGGFPAITNDFRYKFSWSPMGVLTALKNQARAIIDGKSETVLRPWHAIERVDVALAHGYEAFESYPNRDSLPFMADYGIDERWSVERFIRGTLRLDGWAMAWKDIFALLETDEIDETKLADLSRTLWSEHAYGPDEEDRVVLTVALKASRNGQTLWHRELSLDSKGSGATSAMARLVSTPVSLAAEAILEHKLSPGVQAAPSNVDIATGWLDEIARRGDPVHTIDHMQMHHRTAAE